MANSNATFLHDQITLRVQGAADDLIDENDYLTYLNQVRYCNEFMLGAANEEDSVSNVIY